MEASQTFQLLRCWFQLKLNRKKEDCIGIVPKKLFA
jgi:hypothetical protein